MFTNFFRTSLRNSLRHKGFTAINIGGLAVGLAGVLLMGLYVQNELAFDDFHEKGERTYRLGNSTVGWPYGRILEADFPEVEEVSYMRPNPTYSIKHDGQYLFEKMLHADQQFFDVFDFPLTEGNPSTALSRAYSAVISESLARKLFGTDSALDRTLVLADSIDFTITGVVNVPKHSHIQFDVLLSFETLRAQNPEWFEQEMTGGWLDLNVVNYVVLKEGTNAAAFQEKIRNLPNERAGDYLASWGGKYHLELTPMTGIYLNASIGNSLGPQSDMSNVYLLLTVGIFLLLIAAVNFVNLATARSAERAKEVGLRKTIGSSRGMLMGQFLTESFLTCLVAVALGGGIAAISLSYFNELANTSYVVADFLTAPMAGILLLVVVVISIAGGLYPAVLLSSFNPIDALQGRSSSGSRGGLLRKGLVVFQFSISGALVLGTIVVFSQLDFMQNQDLGFDSDQVLVLDARQAPGTLRAPRTDAFLDALANHSAVERVSAVYTVPGRDAWRGQLSFPEGFKEGESIGLEYFPVGWDFAETLGLELVAGRSFDREIQLDRTQSVMINEAAVRAAGWSTAEEAVGKGFTSPGSRKPDGRVIGVVKDYHQHGLQATIEPVMFGFREGNGLFAIRYESVATASVLEHVQKTWAAFFEEYPNDVFFLDADFARQYEKEQRLLRIFGTFASLTILIACLGLFGIAAFTAARRTREIGIRKVMGASTPQIIALMSKDFIRLVLISFAIAAPVGYYVLNTWLEDFAYRTSIGVGVFVVTGALLIATAIISVGYQALRSAHADPVDSLRYE